MVYYLLQKLTQNPEKSKIAALTVLRHLVNTSGPNVEDKKSLIMLGLKPALVSEPPPSNKIKRNICQLSIALADHGFLEADGGRLIADFLMKNLCGPDETTVAAVKKLIAFHYD